VTTPTQSTDATQPNPTVADLAPVETTQTPAKPRKRLFYLDFIRAFSVLVIVLTHFNNPYLDKGGYLLTNTPFNIYIGALGVSQFLIISAAALTITYQRPLNLRKFYKKRFLGIYPMFWIAWIIGTLTLFVLHGGVPANGAPARYFFWTLIGMDGLVANFGFTTMYLLGEWFLGFIVLFYIIFPILQWGVRVHPYITAVAGLGIYAAALAWYLYRPHYLPGGVFLPIRLPELLFGIYFATYFKRVHPLALIPALAVLVASSLLPQIPEDLAVTFVGIAFFVVLAFLAKFLDFGLVKVPVELISKYSYGIFLVHHVIIMEFYRTLNIQAFPPLYKWMAFVAICLLTYGLGVALYHLHDRVMFYVRKALARS